MRQPTRQRTLLKSGCKYLFGNNLPRIKLIRGKLFPDRYYTLFPPVDFSCVCCCQSCWLSRGYRCDLRRYHLSYADSADLDRRPRFTASDLCLHCLHISQLWNAAHYWVAQILVQLEVSYIIPDTRTVFPRI